MGAISPADRDLFSQNLRSGGRRKHPRFDMRFSVFLRALGEPWTWTETGNLSASGAFFITARAFPVRTPVEYILTFPPELTKAPRYLRMRFFASVIRCERIPGGNGAFGVAVRNTAHRYLTGEEAAAFDTLDEELARPAGAVEEIADPTTSS